MELRNIVSRASKSVIQNEVLQKCSEVSITSDQFIELIKEHLSFLPNFETLIEKSYKHAYKKNMTALAEVLLENLNDEKGIVGDGIQHLSLAHETWRNNFSVALGILPDQVLSPLASTIKANSLLLDIEKRNDIFEMAGALLFLEHITILEYFYLKTSRDALFPHIFVINSSDLEEQQDFKKKASYYIDDHIKHDAKFHFPLLLKSLEPYINDEENLLAIKKGIKITTQVLIVFYYGIGEKFKNLSPRNLV